MAEQHLEVIENSEEQITLEFDGLTIQLWRSSLEKDRGQPVVQIDGSGMFRVNVNDYPIWNADPDDHEHHQCQCVTDFEMEEDVRGCSCGMADYGAPGHDHDEEKSDG